MINGFKVITLCGSTRFKDEFQEAQKRLTLEGNVVITVGLFGHSGDDVVWSEGVKDMLDRQHLAKIDLADEIFVINVGGYIGDSTRREIAYAEFKGKTIKYMENSKKASIYENYAALCELHDAGRISDKDYEQAGRDFDEKRKAAIAEYNVCQGPWPYQWKNIDAVVCGILQQMGAVSIDYSDLKDLYDADCVYEVRIKGNGANDEEQLQGIIDAIRSEYLARLRSSKKVVITLCASSDPSGLLEKLADCMNGLIVVWQTRTIPVEAKELEISILYSCIDVEKRYNEWIDKACEFVEKVGPTLNIPAAAMQSNISTALGNNLNVMFLGHDAHEVPKPDYKFENSDYFKCRCKTGNVCWFERNEKWAIWKNLRDCFVKAFGESSIMDDLNHLVFTNAIFFTGDHITEVLNQIGTSVENRCMELTRDLIFDILQPKLLVCFSVNDVFDKLIGSVMKKEGLHEKIIVKKFKPYHIKHTCAITKVDSIIILGIPHPSGAHGVLASLPTIVRIINDLYNGVEIEKIVATKEIYLNASNSVNKNDFERIITIKDKIRKDGTNQWINSDGMLVHEYYCKGNIQKYVKGNGTIAVGLKIDSEENKYVLSILSYGNHPGKFIAKVQGICDESKLFKMDANANFVADVGTDDSRIVIFFNLLLSKMKDYRETDIRE